MHTVVDVLTFAEHVRKASVAFYLSAGSYAAVLATQDLSTWQGAAGAIIALKAAQLVYETPNNHG